MRGRWKQVWISIAAGRLVNLSIWRGSGNADREGNVAPARATHRRASLTSYRRPNDQVWIAVTQSS